MKHRFDTTLVDLSAAMLEVSRRLNPECEHVEGDMRTVDVGRRFDCVFVHDAVCYMTTEADLRAVIATAYAHCAPGGAALFAPDYVKETFRPHTAHGGVDDGGRGLRYLEWTWDPDPTDDTYVVDYVIMLRDGDGSVRVEHERHAEGLFARADWLRLLSEAGFEPSALPCDIAGVEPGVHEVLLARRPAEEGDDAESH
jgi:SAM-dependent methyltransferase